MYRLLEGDSVDSVRFDLRGLEKGVTTELPECGGVPGGVVDSAGGQEG